METSFHTCIVKLFSFICEIGVSEFTLPLNARTTLVFTNAAKQMTKQKLIIGD